MQTMLTMATKATTPTALTMSAWSASYTLSFFVYKVGNTYERRQAMNEAEARKAEEFLKKLKWISKLSTNTEWQETITEFSEATYALIKVGRKIEEYHNEYQDQTIPVAYSDYAISTLDKMNRLHQKIQDMLRRQAL
jgi:hypothetical protein